MRQSLVNGVSAAIMVAVVAGSVGAAAPKKPAGKTASKPDSKMAAKPDAAQIAAGKKVFELGCQGCHKVAGKGGQSGPDLSKEGAAHDAAWIGKKIKDPKASNKSSIMPPFAGTPKDLQAVTAYVASLK